MNTANILAALDSPEGRAVLVARAPELLTFLETMRLTSESGTRFVAQTLGSSDLVLRITARVRDKDSGPRVGALIKSLPRDLREAVLLNDRTAYGLVANAGMVVEVKEMLTHLSPAAREKFDSDRLTAQIIAIRTPPKPPTPAPQK